MTRRRDATPRATFAAFVAVLAVASFAISSAAQAASVSNAPPCRLPGDALLVKSSRLAAVYQQALSAPRGREYTTTGCWKPTGRRTLIFQGTVGSGDFAAAGRFRLAGRYVAFQVDGASHYASTQFVYRANLAARSVGQIAVIPVPDPNFSPAGTPVPSVSALVVNAAGRVGWRVSLQRFLGYQRTEWVGNEIHAHDAGGNRLLDSEARQFTGLRLSSANLLTWYEGVERRTAVLR